MMPFYLKKSKENITVSVPNQPTVIIESLYGIHWKKTIHDNGGKNRSGSHYCGAGKEFPYVWAECL
jgi:hypothetical protein